MMTKEYVKKITSKIDTPISKKKYLKLYILQEMRKPEFKEEGIKGICRKLGWGKYIKKDNKRKFVPNYSRIDYYTKEFRDLGILKKISNGQYDIDEKLLQKSIPLTNYYKGVCTSEILSKFKPDSPRTHAFNWTAKIPKKIDPKKYVKKISYEELPHGVQFKYKNHTVRLYSKSLFIIMEKGYSIISENIEKNLLLAWNDGISLIKSLSKYLRLDLRINGQIWLKLSKKEHALIKNYLAKNYNENKKKLYVYDEKGLWLIIDDSFRLGGELEYVDPEGNDNDVRNQERFQNSFRKQPFTAFDVHNNQRDIRGLIDVVKLRTEADELHRENIISHLGAVKDISKSNVKLTDGLDVMTENVKVMTEAIKELRSEINEFKKERKRKS